jgi:hypothetical protein
MEACALTFSIRPAIREKIGLLFGVAGPSGSGKTLTALMLATGMAGKEGVIGFIDTEAGRALHYAPRAGETADPARHTFGFLHLDFPPPFTPERYVEAIRECEKAGATVNVVDSVTHEWLGEGGCSDIQEQEARRMATNRETGEVDPWRIEAVTAPAWKRPKLLHQRMMARLIQTRSHVIFCMRAQEKIKIVKKASGKGTEIVPIGFQPLCEKNFLYELSGSMMLRPDKPGCPDYALPHKLNADLQQIFPDGSLIGMEAGERLRQWAEGGTERATLDKAAIGVRDLIERIQDADHAGLKVITGDAQVIKQRAWLAENRPELAKRVDDAVTDALALMDTAAPGGDGDLGQEA